MTATLRVLIVDDHPVVRDGMRVAVERLADARVVAEAANGRDALELAATHRPDLVIMDIGMQELNGIETTARMKSACPTIRVLILSGHSSSEFVTRALRAGADGYLVKDSAAAELQAAMKAVMAGDKYLSPRISKHVVDGMLEDRRDGVEGTTGVLSARQREVLQMIAEGKRTKEIAFILGVSTKTVETHRARIMERLAIRDVAGLVIHAVKIGLIVVDGKPPE